METVKISTIREFHKWGATPKMALPCMVALWDPFLKDTTNKASLANPDVLILSNIPVLLFCL